MYVAGSLDAHTEVSPLHLGACPSEAERGTIKNLCVKDFAKLSDEFSGAICVETLVLLGDALRLFRRYLGKLL